MDRSRVHPGFFRGDATGGFLGDRFGVKSMFVAALVISGLGSVASVLSAAPGELIAARMGSGDSLRRRPRRVAARPHSRRLPGLAIPAGVAPPHQRSVILVELAAIILLFPSSEPETRPQFEGIALFSQGSASEALCTTRYSWVNEAPRRGRRRRSSEWCPIDHGRRDARAIRRDGNVDPRGRDLMR